MKKHSATLPSSVGSCLFVHLFLPVNQPVPHVPSPTFQAARGCLILLQLYRHHLHLQLCLSWVRVFFSPRRFPSGKKRPDCDSEVVDAAAADCLDRCRAITRQMDVLSFTWPLCINASLSYLPGMMGRSFSETRHQSFLFPPSSPHSCLEHT